VKRAAPGDVDERRYAGVDAGPHVDGRVPVSLARPTGAPGCWKCGRAGHSECGRVDCGNRVLLTAEPPTAANMTQPGGYKVPARISGD